MLVEAITNSSHDLVVADNRLNQTFAATRPNDTWVTDISYMVRGETGLYLAGIYAFTCELVS